MKACFDCLANLARFQEGYQVWLYHPIRTRRKSPKLGTSWEDPYKVVTQISDVIYRI
jgi:hypothetical protein